MSQTRIMKAQAQALRKQSRAQLKQAKEEMDHHHPTSVAYKINRDIALQCRAEIAVINQLLNAKQTN